MVSISRANLPDAIGLSLSHGRSSQKISLAAAPDLRKEQKSETVCISSGSSRRGNAPHAAFAPGGDIFSSVCRSPHPSSHNPTQYIRQNLPIYPHRSFDPPAASMSLHDLKRNRQGFEMNTCNTSSPNTLEYQSPILIGSQPVLPDGYDVLQGFPRRSVPIAAQPVVEPHEDFMEMYSFPYYDN